MAAKEKRSREEFDGDKMLGKAWAKKHFKVSNQSATCTIGGCTSVIGAAGGNTSGMTRHIQRLHTDFYKSLLVEAEAKKAGGPGTMLAYAKRQRRLLDACP
jgi:hypothetical protein